jgi:hypothetical protein
VYDRIFGFLLRFSMLVYGFFIFQEISSLSVEPCEGELLIVTVFEIKIEGVTNCKFHNAQIVNLNSYHLRYLIF